LSNAAARQILDALLLVDEIVDGAGRRDLLLQLPPHIRSIVRDAPSARAHVLNIVRACDRMGAGGRDAFVETLLLVLPYESPDVGKALDVIEQCWPGVETASED
jgi:hypothetical protein